MTDQTRDERIEGDPINRPPHYEGVSGVECIDAIEAMGCGVDFCRANAVKYLWRLGKKGAALEDAKKAQWYVNRLVNQLDAALREAGKGEVNG